MKRFLSLGWVLLLLCALLVGCRSKNEQAKGSPEKEKTPPAAETSKEKKAVSHKWKKGRLNGICCKSRSPWMTMIKHYL
ncbi:hypothetical protein ACIFOT_26560 [Neobacillus sp. NRS-1170]|uniref:hypothetical protein n=1 Tax=Neobacillus sp. NRS-1170 TaxID=3233898 RepID=UPI003D2B43A4